jgi:hypothetical protein
MRPAQAHAKKTASRAWQLAACAVPRSRAVEFRWIVTLKASLPEFALSTGLLSPEPNDDGGHEAISVEGTVR